MKYKDASSPEEYLEFVLSHWKGYKHHNGGLCKAIRELLDKCKRLEKDIN